MEEYSSRCTEVCKYYIAGIKRENNMFTVNGSRLEILMQLGQEFELTTRESNTIFEYIENHPDILDEEECFTRKAVITEEDDSMNLLLHGSGYYLNVRKITIVLLAAILDYYLTNGMASACLTVLGTELQAVTKLKEEKLCLVKEMLREYQKLYDEFDLCRYQYECVNNDIQCRFNIDGICTLKKETITTVLEKLEKVGVIEKVCEKYKVHIF